MKNEESIWQLISTLSEVIQKAMVVVPEYLLSTGTEIIVQRTFLGLPLGRRNPYSGPLAYDSCIRSKGPDEDLLCYLFTQLSIWPKQLVFQLYKSIWQLKLLRKEIW